MARGITESDVHTAADAIVNAGERPTVERIRAQVGPEDCPLPGQIPACLMAYHYVLDGRLWLGLDGQPPLAVGAGEIILLPRNPPHVLSSDPRLPAQRIEPLVQPAPGGGLARPGPAA